MRDKFLIFCILYYLTFGPKWPISRVLPYRNNAVCSQVGGCRARAEGRPHKDQGDSSTLAGVLSPLGSVLHKAAAAAGSVWRPVELHRSARNSGCVSVRAGEFEQWLWEKNEEFKISFGSDLCTTFGPGSSCRNLPTTCRTGWETSSLPPRPLWKNWIHRLLVWSNQSAGFCPAASCSCRGGHLERLKVWRLDH